MLSLLERLHYKLVEVKAGGKYREFLCDKVSHLKWKWRWQQTLFRYLTLWTAGQINRLAITGPVRHGKSEGITINHPGFLLSKAQPRSNVIVAAHSQSLANDFSRRTRTLVKDCIGISDDNASVSTWQTSEGGMYRATGTRGSLAGKGANRIYCDDPVPNRIHAESELQRKRLQDWWDNDLITRINPGEDHGVILTMARWNPEDIFQTVAVAHQDRWKVLRFPAVCDYDPSDTDELARQPDIINRDFGDPLCASLWPKARLLEIKKTVSLYTWLSLYQCRPTFRDGIFFETSKIRMLRCINDPSMIVNSVRAFDYASNEDEDSSYSATVRIHLMSYGDYVIDHAEMVQKGPAARDRWQRQLAEADQKRFHRLGVTQIEERQPAAAGTERARSFLNLMDGFRCQVLRAEGDKVTRADPLAGQVGGGMVSMVKPMEGERDWNTPLLDQMRGFPAVKLKDLVDALSLGYYYLSKRKSATMSAASNTMGAG